MRTSDEDDAHNNNRLLVQSIQPTQQEENNEVSLWKRVQTARSKYFVQDKQTQLLLDEEKKEERSRPRKKVTLVIRKKGNSQSQANNAASEENQILNDCCVCKASLENLSLSEREKHLNHCLDQHASEVYIKNQLGTSMGQEDSNYLECFICGKDLTHYSEIRKQQHINQCCEVNIRNQSSSEDFELQSRRKQKAKKIKENSCKKRSRTFENDEQCAYSCLICKKDLTSEQARNRMKHLKNCAKLNNITVSDIKQLVTKRKKIRIDESKKKPTTAVSDNEQRNTESNNDNIFEAFKFGIDSRLRGKMSDSSCEEFLTVSDWLKSLHFEQYIEPFMNNGYDTLEICSTLELEDLENIGVKKSGHKKQLLIAAKQLTKTLIYRNRMQQLDQKKKETRMYENTREINSIEEQALQPLLQSENRISNTQIAEQIMKEIHENTLLEEESEDIVPTQPMQMSRLGNGKSSNREQSIWDLSRAGHSFHENDKIMEKEQATRASTFTNSNFSSLTPTIVEDTVAEKGIEDKIFKDDFVEEVTNEKDGMEEEMDQKNTGEKLMEEALTPIDSCKKDYEITPKVRRVLSQDIGPGLCSSPIVIDDTPKPITQAPSVKIDSDIEQNDKGSNDSDSLLDIDIFPLKNAAESFVPVTQSFSQEPDHNLSPILLHSDQSDSDNDQEYGNYPSVLYVRQFSQKNEVHNGKNEANEQLNNQGKIAALENVKKSLNILHAAYMKRCEREVSAFSNRVNLMYQTLRDNLENYANECRSDIKHESEKFNFSYDFEPFPIPKLSNIFNESSKELIQNKQFIQGSEDNRGSNVENNVQKTSTLQLASKEKQLNSQGKGDLLGRLGRARKSPKKRSSYTQARRAVVYDMEYSTQVDEKKYRSNSDIGTNSESDFGNYSDSEIDWAKQKKGKAQRDERLIRNLIPDSKKSCSSQLSSSQSKPLAVNAQTNSSNNPNTNHIPDFSSMEMAELKAYLSRYGVKPGTRTFMIQMCSKIYQSQQIS
jgi:hypothetical protein